MAFCTTCGANVPGAFCNQCGTPVSAAAGAPAAPPAPPPMAPVMQAAPAAMPVKKGLSPIVWILIVVGGLFVFGCIAVVGTVAFVAHKVRQAGVDPDLWRKNPGLAVSKMIAATNPNVEVVNTDDGKGTITLRDKKTGKVVTMNFDEARNGKFTFSAEGDDGKTATMEFGAGSTLKLPSWVPEYPGSKPQGTFSARGDDGNGQGEGGMFTFTTRDDPAKVIQYYQDKAKDMNMKSNVAANTPDGGMLILSDEDSKRSLQVTVGKGSDGTSVAVTYAAKK
jgi:hypothetical protein